MQKRVISLMLAIVLVLSTLVISSASVGAVEIAEDLDNPTIISTESGIGGDVIIKWNPVPNAVKYRVLHLRSDGYWKEIGDTYDTTFTGKGATNGATYTYAVACISEDGEEVSGYSRKCSHKYVSTPTFKPLTAGFDYSNHSPYINIEWNKVNGAVKYILFYQLDNNWIKLVETTSTSYQAKGPKPNTVYTYAVKAITADGWESGIDENGKSIAYKASYKALTPIAVGEQINLNDEIKKLKDAPIYGKNISSWVVSNPQSVCHRPNSKYLTGIKENTSSFLTVTATDGSKLYLFVRVMSFNEAIKGVCCKISGRHNDDWLKSTGVLSPQNLKDNPEYVNFKDAKVDVPLYNGKTGTGNSGVVPNGQLAQITDYYYTGSPKTSRFKVTYLDSKKTGWVEERYALINALGLTPSYRVSLSFASNRAYTYHKAKGILDGRLYNMFNYKGGTSDYITYISGITDGKNPDHKSYYNYNTAWLRFDFAKKLANEQARLLQEGYGIRIYDAYRPHAVTSYIDEAWDNYINKYDLTEKSSTKNFKAWNPKTKKYDIYVDCSKNPLTYQIASPNYVSRHNFGAAVDISLVIAETGTEVDMPTLMHDLSWNAEYGKWINGSSKGAQNARYLLTAMRYGGFDTYYGEWWHFQDNSISYDNAVIYCASN